MVAHMKNLNTKFIDGTFKDQAINVRDRGDL